MGALLHALHAHQPLPDIDRALAHYQRQAALAQAGGMPRFQPPPEPAFTPEWAHQAAEAHVLGDVDMFTDWLGGECMRQVITLPVLPADVGALQLVIDKASVPQLVAMLLYPGATVRAMASDELRERYLKAHPGYIARMVEQFAWGER